MNEFQKYQIYISITKPYCSPVIHRKLNSQGYALENFK